VGDTFEVMGVITGGPAEEAGLQAGDQVLSVDDTASAELFLPDLRVRWRNQPVSSRVQLTVRRGEQVLVPVMELRDLIAPPRHIAEDGR
jgi:predicted metalloprotease with PDZ domain